MFHDKIYNRPSDLFLAISEVYGSFESLTLFSCRFHRNLLVNFNIELLLHFICMLRLVPSPNV